MKLLVIDDEKEIEILFQQQFRKEIRDGQVIFVFAFFRRDAIDILQSEALPEVVYIFFAINMLGIELPQHV